MPCRTTGVRGHDRGDVGEPPTAQAMAELRQPSSFLIVEAQSLLKPRLQHSVLFAEERDDVVLFVLQPPAQHRRYKVKRRHRRSLRQHPDPAWDTTRLNS